MLFQRRDSLLWSDLMNSSGNRTRVVVVIVPPPPNNVCPVIHPYCPPHPSLTLAISDIQWTIHHFCKTLKYIDYTNTTIKTPFESAKTYVFLHYQILVNWEIHLPRLGLRSHSPTTIYGTFIDVYLFTFTSDTHKETQLTS